MPPTLDERLQTALELVRPCALCADIGADHGKLSALLLATNRARHVIAADVSAKALAKAEHRLRVMGLSLRATLMVADGLAALPETAPFCETVCILGMGGETISDILADGAERLHGAALVLGPHTQLELVRETLQKIGYALVSERIACADGRMYVVMLAEPAQGTCYTEKELLLGPCLLKTHTPHWRAYFKRRERLLCETLAGMESATTQQNGTRRQQTRRELGYVRQALLEEERSEDHDHGSDDL